MRKRHIPGELGDRQVDGNPFRLTWDGDKGLTIKHDETGLRLSVIARGDSPTVIYVEAYSYWGDEVLTHVTQQGFHPVTGYTVHERPDHPTLSTRSVEGPNR